MNRRDILRPRQYAAIPKATLARTDLTASAKIVYTSLIGHLFSDAADRAYPSTTTLANTAGIGRRTVIRALSDLQAAGLIEAHSRPGRVTVYTFPAADGEPHEKPPGLPLDHTQAESAHPEQTGPESNRHAPPANMTPPSDAGPEPKKTTTPANMPATHAKSGLDHKDEERSKVLLEEPPSPSGGKGDLSTVLQNLKTAYREATGRQMPASWTGPAKAEFTDGDRETITAITPAQIRAGQAYAQRRNLAFAFRTMMLAIHQRPKPGATQPRVNPGVYGHLADQAAKTTAAGRSFETLSPVEQNAFRKAARAKPGFQDATPDVIESMAAMMADDQARETNPEQRKHA